MQLRLNICCFLATKSILIDPLCLQLNGVIMKRTEMHEHLGLVFNSSLTWSDHMGFQKIVYLI